MSEKTYVLELTAAEVEASHMRFPDSTRARLGALKAQVEADRLAHKPALPWKAGAVDKLGRPVDYGAPIVDADGEWPGRAEDLKLMAAAPELLDAVKAANERLTGPSGHGCFCSCPVIDGHSDGCLIVRALRKAGVWP